MADTTGIDYADHSWGPWRGCTKVSAGCANCYAEREMSSPRFGAQDPTAVVRARRPTFRRPLARYRDGTYHWPDGNRVFVCPWSDCFHADADKWRPDAWDIIRQRPRLIFIIPTKRPGRIADCLPDDWGTGWPNVWLLVSVEDQGAADLRIPQLLQVPAAVRGVSCEPLLGPVDLSHSFRGYLICGCGVVTWPEYAPHAKKCPGCGAKWGAIDKLNFCIAGGESGPGARPMHPDWVRGLRDQCQVAGVPFWFKQWGEWIHRGYRTRQGLGIREEIKFHTWPDGTVSVRVGRKKAGHVLDWRQWSEVLEVNG